MTPEETRAYDLLCSAFLNQNAGEDAIAFQAGLIAKGDWVLQYGEAKEILSRCKSAQKIADVLRDARDTLRRVRGMAPI